MARGEQAQGLEALLKSLRAESDAPAPAAPAAAQGQAAPDELKEFLKARVAELEAALAAERGRERNQGAVEEQLRAVSELIKRERESSHSRGRIEALEARLDKLHEAWTAALDRLLAREAPPDRGPELARLQEGLAGLSARLDAQAAALERLGAREAPADRGPELAQLREGLAGLSARLGELHEAWTAALHRLLVREAPPDRGPELARLQESLAGLQARFDAQARELRDLLAAGFAEAARRDAGAAAAVRGLADGVERSRAEMETVAKRLFALSQAVERARLRAAEDGAALAQSLAAELRALPWRAAALFSRREGGR